MLRALFLLVLLAGAAAAGAAGGYQYARDGGVAVTVREGAPELEEGVDAILIVDARLIAEAVRAALEEADLPVQFEVTDVTVIAEGLRVTGRVIVGVAGADVRADLATTAVPRAGDDGGVAVDLADTSVEGVRLPEGLEAALARLISDVVSSQTRVPGYSVRRIETSEDQYFVYFAENGAAPTD